MTLSIMLIYLAAMLAACASWAIPRERALDFMAVFTLLIIGLLSPFTAIWLLTATLISWTALRASQNSKRRGLIALLCAALLLSVFVAAQFTNAFVWIGMSFFTLRMLHVIGDWWTGKLATPALPQLLRYHLFLPVIIIGPIHRFQTFSRQAARRRWDSGEFLSGVERCLVGLFMAHFMGEVVLGRIAAEAGEWSIGFAPFWAIWTDATIGWVRLYFIFAGLTSLALGASQMMGMRLEENFNQPWRARNMLDFWNRWHMSLTNWSREYAYRPVMAITRQPLIGLVAAMLVIGLWHDISAYYVGWSIWQALGIVASRFGGKILSPADWPAPLRSIIIPLAILGWLSAARPVLTILLGLDYDPHSSPF